MFVVPTKLIDVVVGTKSFAIGLNVVEEIIVLRRPP